MLKKFRLLLCLFALSPPEEKKRRQRKGAGGGSGRFCRARNRGGEEGREELLTEEEREGWNHVEEPSNCPTSMHRWAWWLVAPVTLPLFKEIQFYTDFYRSHHKYFYSIFFTAGVFDTRFQILSILDVWLPQIPFGWWQWFFQQESTQFTVHWHIDGHGYTERIQRDRNREGERQRTKSGFWASCLHGNLC